MIYGLDNNNERICASYADRKNRYKCPGCGANLILKRGEINIPHFAHEKHQRCDLLTENKMTMWNLNHQKHYHENEREVILTFDGVKHIADVKTGNVIIEFQHSPISHKVFSERNQFYHNFGTVVWVFDLINKKENIDYTTYHWERKCNISCGKEENFLSDMKWWQCPCRYCEDNKGRTNTYYHWKNASRMLGQCDFKALDNAGMKCFFQFEENCFVRVTWNKNGVKTFSGYKMGLDGFHRFIERLKAIPE